jgi:hypothetical protein
VVALVPVAFTNVKFWRVEEPVTKRFEIDPIVREPMDPEPRLKLVEKRLVDDAVVEKRFVVVAAVVVDLVMRSNI